MSNFKAIFTLAVVLFCLTAIGEARRKRTSGNSYPSYPNDNNYNVNIDNGNNYGDNTYNDNTYNDNNYNGNNYNNNNYNGDNYNDNYYGDDGNNDGNIGDSNTIECDPEVTQPDLGDSTSAGSSVSITDPTIPSIGSSAPSTVSSTPSTTSSAPSTSSSPPSSGTGSTSPSDEEFINGCLQYQNAVRQSVGVSDLTWNSDLAAGAQQWAEKIAADGSLNHSHGSYGENLASGTTNSYNLQALINLWIKEGKDFISGCTYPSCSTGGTVGHYTQLVWGKSTEVGCGIAYANNWSYLCCRYLVQGNIMGQKVY